MTPPTFPTITLGGQEYAVVPRAEYEALRNAVDEDAMDAAIIQRVLEDPDQELLPFELVKRIAGGEHPVRVWRDYRGTRAAELAAAAGIAASYLSDIENRKKPGSVRAMKRIADALNVTVDDLI
ncbi:MAG: helix-turn-helix transcriptional regulator [Bryobacterales bacterium]|jgi:DNA-binding Xre family transcriptional regulator|nr:helix-turn-helix transcriptional regulator [Bryobacterales bacterium]MDE0293440.1 helix-turn-helix transcriptional regulator [Bryobacterales bacterium]MDE0432825.1 helix-turn-helix transcriptional regulator [Bryobacterales bacterium]